MLRFMSLLTSLLLSLGARAAPAHYDLNAAATSAVLSWKVLGMGNSHADVSGITGRLDLYPQQDINDRIQVSIPVRNIDAHNRILTDELKSPVFFDQERYPYVTFTSTRVVSDGQDRYHVFGSLHVKAISHPIILEAKVISLEDPWTGERHLTFYADTAIERSAYDMTRYIPMVSDRINIHIMMTLPQHSAAPEKRSSSANRSQPSSFSTLS
ncbi:YceI family protein [Acerihabitans arboris]|uniref:Lipid/polyisoprenoid-binding YceI-like domain-containing protein n=1 Tax=Acerihabitans arboris TaxID=2691583 RepID=A0A845SJL3_9GAMM|nr:YceI family protein [Acerihabitans arboris]NDL63154.1 hypothetical protein [Acerihabitans arboris]